MQDLNQLTDQILDFSDEEILWLFSQVAKQMSLIFDTEDLPLVEASIDVQIAVDNISDFSKEDATTILRNIGCQKELPFPRTSKAESIPKIKIITPVIITTNGAFFHKENCKYLYWVSNTGTRRVERDSAAQGKYGRKYKPCNHCRPDG